MVAALDTCRCIGHATGDDPDVATPAVSTPRVLPVNSAAGEPTWTIRPDVVRAAMAHLGSRTMPSFFIAYLHFRERSIATGGLTGLRWDWDMLKPSLALPGGPEGKPFYRPFLETSRGASNWMNYNLSGSWSPRSTRSGGPAREVISFHDDDPRAQVTLRQGHVQLALEHLLGGHPVPAVSWAVWWLRDYGFAPTPAAQQPYLVVEAFRAMFRFTGEDSDDFGTLFDVPEVLPHQDWFEPGPKEHRS